MLFESPQQLKKEYDVAVIGGGLGGLTAANVLAKKFGYRVVLFEQHHKLGGLATWFKRKGHIFDVSLHGFPYGMIKTCKKYWNKEISDSIVQLQNIRFINPQFTLITTFDEKDFTDKLINFFKVETETVKEFFKTVRGMDFYHDHTMTNLELFEKFFPGRKDIVRFLMEPITYANGSSLADPAITYGIVFSNFMNKGVYTFCGGTDLVIGKMQKELLNNNVDIALSSFVEKVVVYEGSTTGVISAGVKINCGSVLSNANILTTINKLVGENCFPEEFMKDVNKVRLNNSSCQVYMGIKEGEKIEEVGDLIFTSEEPEFSASSLCSMETTSRTFSVYYPKTRPGHNMYSIVASTNANYEDWADLSDEEYRIKKDKLREVTFTSLEKLIPGIRKKIDYAEVATPRTFKRYTLHEKGASFGTKFEGLSVSMNLNNNIKGLFHTGSVGIIMSGWLGAANYGVIVANNIDKYLLTRVLQ